MNTAKLVIIKILTRHSFFSRILDYSITSFISITASTTAGIALKNKIL